SLGGLSKATAGVILRQLIAFADQGADKFFGEPEFDTADLLRTDAEGRGIISCLELPGVRDQPALFSTFLMWLLAELFQDLPEVGNPDKPKLVFFFDEAHLLFKDASKAFLESIEQAVRLIRSKGVGVFFVTQVPDDVPESVLAQLGNRVQHALRAFTPKDAKALKAAATTFPISDYDLEEVLTQLGTGEAIITVLSDRGAPTPVAQTQPRAPQAMLGPSPGATAVGGGAAPRRARQAMMGPSPEATVDGVVAASVLTSKYSEALDRESAYEKLAARMEAGAKAAAEAQAAEAEEKEAKVAAKAPRSRAKEDES